MTRTGWKVLAGAGGCLALAPVLGLLVTVVGLIFSFRAVSDVDPAEKAQRLAQGISFSMWATAIGLAAFPIGIAVLSIALYQLFKKPPR